MGGISGEAGGGDPLVMGTLVPPQALTCPHLPNLQAALYCRDEGHTRGPKTYIFGL